MPDLFHHTQIGAPTDVYGSGTCGGAKFSMKRGAKALSKAGKSLTTKKQRKMVGDAAAERLAGVMGGSKKFSMKKTARALSKSGKTLTTKKQRKMVGDAAARALVAAI